jgi:hypothetical protein
MRMNTYQSSNRATVVAASEIILSRHFDQDVHLTLRDTLTTRKSLVLRCAVTPPASHLPTTIIAKCPMALPDDPFADRVSFIEEYLAS